MSRFNERLLDAFDVFDEFEFTSSNDHIYHTLGVIHRLKDEGSQYFANAPDQLERWEQGCKELCSFFNRLGSHRDSRRHETENRGEEFDAGATAIHALRDFIDQFEHIECRIHQMLSSDELNANREEALEHVWVWLNILYRFATYSIIATFIDGKQTTSTVHVTVGLTTGETSERWEHEPMQSPKRFLRKLRNERANRI